MKSAVYILILLIIVFFVTGWAFPSYWNWAVFHPHELSLPAYVLIVLTFLLLAVKPVGEIVYNQFRAILGPVYKGLFGLPKIVRYVLWVVVPALLLYTLRVDSLIMGDGLMIVSNIRQAEMISSTAFGASLLVKALAAIFPGMAPSTPESLMAAVSIACGIVYIICVNKILALLIEDNQRRFIFFLIVILSGVSVLFAGYVETYALLTAWLSVYLYFSIRFLRGETGTAALCIIYAAGVFWHIWFLAFLPSLLFLLNQRFGIISRLTTVLISIAYIIGIYIGGHFIERSGIPLVTPFLPTDESSYVLFSPTHLLDFLNLIVIVAPVLVLAAIVFLISGEKQENRSRTFISFAFLSSMAVAFMLDPALGMARDWDLLSIFALPGILLGIILIENSIAAKKLRASFLLPILLLGLIHSSLFLNTLNSKTKTVDRIVRILYDDPHYRADYHNGKRIPPFSTILSNVYGLHEAGAEFMKRRAQAEGVLYNDIMNMAGHYYNNGDYQTALEYFEKVPLELISNAQYLFHYGRALQINEKYEQAIEVFQKVLADTAIADVYHALGRTYLEMKQPQEAFEHFLMGAPLTGDSLKYLSTSANLLAQAGNPGMALDLYRRIGNSAPDYPELDLSRAMAFHGYGTIDSAQYYYRRTLNDNPGSYDALTGMAKIHFGRRNLDSALAYFRESDERYPGDANVLFGLGMTYAEIGKSQTAISLLNRVLRQAPDVLQAHDVLAKLYIRVNQPRDAVSHWQKTLDLDSSFAAAHFGLAQAYDMLGDNVNAYRELQKWLEFGNIDVNTPAARQLMNKYKPR